MVDQLIGPLEASHASRLDRAIGVQPLLSQCCSTSGRPPELHRLPDNDCGGIQFSDRTKRKLRQGAKNQRSMSIWHAGFPQLHHSTTESTNMALSYIQVDDVPSLHSTIMIRESDKTHEHIMKVKYRSISAMPCGHTCAGRC